MGTSDNVSSTSNSSLLPFEPDSLRWDSLTGLADRQYILKSLQTWLSQNNPQPISLVLFNIENFKLVNRSVGHRIGDRWLCAIARRLQSHASSYSLVGRLSGDEFLMISCDPNQSKTDVSQVSRKIAAALSKPVAVGGRVMERKVNSSCSSSHGRTISGEKLLSEAEARMRRIRKKRRCASETKLYNSDEYRDLQRAIEAGQQIEVHYQPEVDLQTGHIVGVEALARWQHPTKGLQPACEFIALAERSGLVVPLSWLVLHRALNQMMIWRQRYEQLSLTVRVNASPLQLMSKGFAKEVLQALSFHRLPPSVLCIEVTEHQVMQCKSVVMEELERLREKGVTIALDDFGVGHSSLSRLRDLPADCLKIDRSFVQACDKTGRDRSVIDTIRRLADAYELLVVAEGIEQQSELDLLKKVGVTRGQGALFALALPAENIEKLFSKSYFEEKENTSAEKRENSAEEVCAEPA